MSGVADRPLGRADIDERVIVAVGQNPADKDKIARGLALVPQLLARAREKPRRAGVHRQLQGLLVRVAEHQDFAVSLILADNRHQRSLFEKFR